MTSARELARLLREAGVAHHRAFAHTNGADPAWAEWYAMYLQARLAVLLERSFEVEALAAELTTLDVTHRRVAPMSPWAEYYAGELLRRYGSS